MALAIKIGSYVVTAVVGAVAVKFGSKVKNPFKSKKETNK